MKWSTVPLGKVVEVAAGQAAPPASAFDDTGTPFVRAGSVEGLMTRANWHELEHLSEATAKKQGMKLFPADTVVFAKSGMSAALGRVFRMDRSAYVVSHLAALKPTGKADPAFLTHWLAHHGTHRLIRDPGYPSIRLSDVEEMPFPDICPQEQRRIAAILDQADALRRLRRDSLARLADLGQAIFYEMFGDVVANERQLPSVTLNEYIRGFDTGKNLAADPDNDSAINRVLKISAVTSGRFDPREAKPLPNTYRPPASHFVRNGDLLFSRANTAALIGATAIVSDAGENLVLPDKLWRFQWHGKAEPVFTHHLFQSRPMRAEISRRASGTSGSMKNIGKGKVLSIRLGLPGPAQRQEFEHRINTGQHVIDAARQALSEADKLFASLQHRAFRGEL